MILTNRFYEGKVVYHSGRPDEEVRDGTHDLPSEVKELWMKCQKVRQSRSQSRHVLITREHRFYPLSGPLKCNACERPYHGKATKRTNGKVALKMEHALRRCGAAPTMVAAPKLHAEFTNRVLRYLVIDAGWRRAVLRTMDTSEPVEDMEAINRLKEAEARLRKLYLCKTSRTRNTPSSVVLFNGRRIIWKGSGYRSQCPTSIRRPSY